MNTPPPDSNSDPVPLPPTNPRLPAVSRSDVFGPYRVLEELGRGGMGVVFRAEDTALDRQVALKVMLPDVAADENARFRFMREARAQAAVEHENVAVIHYVGEANGVPFIAMPLLKGMTLSAALKQNSRPPLNELIRIGREMAEGLSAAHAVGLVHRDIKPANIWLDGPKRRVKILDFGLARAQHDDTQLTGRGAILGTPAYMSPEQARGTVVDHRSDLFSLGVVLYLMATGKLPFVADSTVAMLFAVAEHHPPAVHELAPDVPRTLSELIWRLMAKNPADRPQTAAAVAAELALLEGQLSKPAVVPVPVPSDPWSELTAQDADDDETEYDEEPRRSPAPKPRWMWPAVGVSCVLVVAVGVWISLPPRPKAVAEKPAEVPKPSPLPTPTPKPKPKEEPLQPRTGKDALRESVAALLKAGAKVSVPGGKTGYDLLSADELRGARVRSVLFMNSNKRSVDPAAAIAAMRTFPIDGWDDEGGFFGPVHGLTEEELKELVRMPGPRAAAKWGLILGKLPEEALVHFAELPNLRSVQVLLGTNVTATGLKHLAALPVTDELLLQLDFTPGALVGLRAYVGSKLELSRSGGVDDAGLAHLAPLTTLRHLILKETQVTKAGVEKLAKALPRCQITWDGGTVGPSISPDRAAAEYVLSLGGSVTILRNGVRTGLGPKGMLPPGEWELTAVELPRAGGTDAGMANFVGCTALVSFNAGYNDIGDAGFAHLRNCTKLTKILIGSTNITDAGFAHFKGCKEMTHVGVTNTAVTDAVFDVCKAFPNLTVLDTRDTQTTASGAKAFAHGFPACQIEWGKGMAGGDVIGPRK